MSLRNLIQGVLQVGSAALGTILGVARLQGNVYAAAGNPIAGNAADTTDDVLGGVQLPAGVLDVAGRQVNVYAQGQTGATTNNKRYKVWVNPTLSGATVNADGSISGGTVTAGTPLADSGSWVNATTPNSNVGWAAECVVTKYGARGANTQVGQAQVILGGTHGGVQAGQALTLPENAPVNIVVTGSSPTTGAAGDVKLQQLTVNVCN